MYIYRNNLKILIGVYERCLFLGLGGGSFEIQNVGISFSLKTIAQAYALNMHFKYAELSENGT